MKRERLGGLTSQDVFLSHMFPRFWFKNALLVFLIDDRALRMAGEGVSSSIEILAAAQPHIFSHCQAGTFKAFVIFPDFPAWKTAFPPR